MMGLTKRFESMRFSLINLLGLFFFFVLAGACLTHGHPRGAHQTPLSSWGVLPTLSASYTGRDNGWGLTGVWEPGRLVMRCDQS